MEDDLTEEELEAARERLRNYVPLLARLTKEQRQRILEPHGDEVSGSYAI
jgi:hypothetical protein